MLDSIVSGVVRFISPILGGDDVSGFIACAPSAIVAGWFLTTLAAIALVCTYAALECKHRVLVAVDGTALVIALAALVAVVLLPVVA